LCGAAFRDVGQRAGDGEASMPPRLTPGIGAGAKRQADAVAVAIDSGRVVALGQIPLAMGFRVPETRCGTTR
jgi:hypothetical protein